MSVLMHEVFKLLHHAGATDVKMFRLGTSGGLGVEPGTVVVSNGAVNPEGKEIFEQVRAVSGLVIDSGYLEITTFLFMNLLLILSVICLGESGALFISDKSKHYLDFCEMIFLNPVDKSKPRGLLTAKIIICALRAEMNEICKDLIPQQLTY